MIALANKVDRILENVRAVLGPDSYNSIVAALGQLSPQATPSKQAKYAKAAIDMVVESSSEDAAERVMRTCGHQCISTSLIERAKKLHSLSTSIDEFLRLLRQVSSTPIRTGVTSANRCLSPSDCSFSVVTTAYRAIRKSSIMSKVYWTSSSESIPYLSARDSSLPSEYCLQPFCQAFEP